MVTRTCAVLLAAFLVLHVTPCASGAPKKSMSKFILAVHDDYDPHEVAAEINQRSDSQAHDWYGSVEKTHSMIKVIIISGKSNTCEVLHDVDGIKTCEADSVVSVHD